MQIELVLVIFVIGLLMTIKGGDIFIEGAIWIVKKTGISSGIIGATIVSIATTLPEFFVSTIASDEGFSDIAIGNSIGSYICNIALIIGICALIRPIKIDSIFFGIKGTMMIGFLSIFSVLSLKGVVTYGDGYILISLIVLFIIINLIENKKISTNNRITRKSIKIKELIFNLIKFFSGAIMILYGAHILVDSGVKIANFLRIPKLVVSLTLLAIGTSLPELVTALSSVFKNYQSISIGNILGANIINLSIIMGTVALVSEHGLMINKQNLLLDLPVAMLVSLLFILSGIFKEKISRSTGLILMVIYIVYIIIHLMYA
ncbi:calcium/sodium antiporter [Schnuerera sp. xch1]|uniref:calcium/sodium antiporter n=1 Tax=Schnuerera sp. xch1 TaxID=2874283 RepID=UPI001CBDC88A|nr:calcium/sodium antiporter [Schnuerera sp. xch1]MBZ2175687.1 calcium/sodium antiporter [Schnuerera sp. xch1]